jgi:type IV pilus assembly protein PilV
MKQQNFSNNSRYTLQGFTLLEILVTLVVLSIGLLGLAGLQMNGLKSNHSAYLRSQASILTLDIADRMHANRVSAITGAYDIDIGTDPASVSCEGAGSNCGTGTLAAADLFEWKTLLDDILPQGDGSISRTAVGNDTMVTITVQWDDSKGKDAPVQLTTESLL